MSFMPKKIFLSVSVVLLLILLNVSCGTVQSENIKKNTTTTSKTLTQANEINQATDINKTETANTSAVETTQKPDDTLKEKIETKKTPVQKVICIDPGHQIKINNKTEPIAPSSREMKVQNPGGAQGVSTGVPEYKLNLAVSEKLKTLLEQNGYKVVMTRETNNVDLGNIARANIANECNADLYIRIHADGMDDSSVRGISVLVPGSQYIKDKNILNSSKSAARKVLDGLISETGAKSRGIVERNDLTGFNWVKVPMLLVEMGFMSNPGEDKLMNTDSYRDKLAKGIYNGINTYFDK